MIGDVKSVSIGSRMEQERFYGASDIIFRKTRRGGDSRRFGNQIPLIGNRLHSTLGALDL